MRPFAGVQQFGLLPTLNSSRKKKKSPQAGQAAPLGLHLHADPARLGVFVLALQCQWLLPFAPVARIKSWHAMAEPRDQLERSSLRDERDLRRRHEARIKTGICPGAATAHNTPRSLADVGCGFGDKLALSRVHVRLTGL